METIRGRPSSPTSKRQGIRKRCRRARRPDTARSSGRSRVTVNPTGTVHPGLKRTSFEARISRTTCKARSSGVAVKTASAGVKAEGSSGSRSSRETEAHRSWNRLVSG